MIEKFPISSSLEKFRWADFNQHVFMRTASVLELPTSTNLYHVSRIPDCIVLPLLCVSRTKLSAICNENKWNSAATFIAVVDTMSCATNKTKSRAIKWQFQLSFIGAILCSTAFKLAAMTATQMRVSFNTFELKSKSLQNVCRARSD